MSLLEGEKYESLLKYLVGGERVRESGDREVEELVLAFLGGGVEEREEAEVDLDLEEGVDKRGELLMPALWDEGV